MDGALPPSAVDDPDDDTVGLSPDQNLLWSVQDVLTASPQVEEATVVIEDDCVPETSGSLVNQRNLLSWSVSIPCIDFSEDVLKRDRVPVFCIDVERNDRKNRESSLRF